MHHQENQNGRLFERNAGEKNREQKKNQNILFMISYDKLIFYLIKY